MKLYIFLIIGFIFSCSKRQTPQGEVYARVSTNWLDSENIDSVFMSDLINKENLPALIDSWVESSLFYEEAKKAGLNKDKYLKRRRDDYFRQLLISSYLESMVINSVSIPEDTIKDYYMKNRSSFTRNSDEVFAEQFFVNNKDDGEKLKKLLLLGKETKSIKNEIVRSGFGIIKKGAFSGAVDFSLFNKREKIVGPILINSDVVVFRVLQSFEKGSVRGLDEVHDEIYQRMLQLKKGHLRFVLLDSLKSNSDVYINSKYR